MRRERLEHIFIGGKPKGVLTSVEHLDYQGTIDGKPAYKLSALEKWKSAAITTWFLLVLAGLYWFARAHGYV